MDVHKISGMPHTLCLHIREISYRPGVSIKFARFTLPRIDRGIFSSRLGPFPTPAINFAELLAVFLALVISAMTYNIRCFMQLCKIFWEQVSPLRNWNTIHGRSFRSLCDVVFLRAHRACVRQSICRDSRKKFSVATLLLLQRRN